MKIPSFSRSLFIAPGLAFLLAGAAHAADATTSTIKFSDPSKPGTLKVQIARGDLRITGADQPEISVRSETQEMKQTPRKDGLRVLSAAAGFSLSEQDNVVTLDSASEGWFGNSADFDVTVPRNTHVIVQNSWGGDVTCSGLSGDIEVNSMHGEVRLDEHAGGAIVATMNGEIHAAIMELQESRPLSFTSMNGEVLVRLPADAKANVRLRTHNGSILTDFEEDVLSTRTESTGGASVSRVTHSGSIPPEAREAIREAVRAGAEIAREVAAVAKEAAQAAREGAESGREGVAVAPRAPRAPRAPTPPIPPMTGGKLVTGVLNGGGPEINVATMNGDVTLRRLK